MQRERPVVQIYGLVVSVLISGGLQSPMTLYAGFIQLGAGLSVGLAGLAAGFAIGIVGDAGVRGVAQQSRVFVGMVRVKQRDSGLASSALASHTLHSRLTTPRSVRTGPVR